MLVESISDSSEGEELKAHKKLTHKRVRDVDIKNLKKENAVLNQEILKKRNKKAKKSVPIIDIDDSSDDSDSRNHSSNRPVKCADTKRDFASATTINQLHRKPMHPNLISATTTESDFSSLSLPPRHPTSDTVPQNLKEGKKSKHEANQQHRVSPISHSTNQSNKIKSLVLWRRRLWPSLTAFYRILLRCHCKLTPASCLPPNTLTTDALQDLDKFVEMQEGELSLEWGAFWDPSSLQPLSLRFTSATEHNRQLFLLLLEECRSSMSTRFRRHKSETGHKDLKWQRGEVKVITTNLRDCLSSFSASRSSSAEDPRLGKLWMLQIQLLAPKRSRSDSDLSSASTYSNSQAHRFVHKQDIGAENSPEGYRPGELLACRNPQWGNRLALGVVQGYDPDYDMLLSSPNDDFQYTTINLLVCVNTTSDITNIDEKPIGWIIPELMTLSKGSLLQLSSIGNIVTHQRECQAISSVAALSPSLRDLVLCTDENSKFSKMSRYDHKSCPPGISNNLWSSLCKRHNKSQLEAIGAVIEAAKRATAMLTPSEANNESESRLHFPLVLIQGPPGTGKTATILGIIAALFDIGILSKAPPQGKKIRIGSSLKSDAYNRVATSCKKMGDASQGKPRILLCAPSNTAVDELIYRVTMCGVLGSDGRTNRNLKVVRIGQPLQASRSSSFVSDNETVKALTLDNLVEKKRREIESAQRRDVGRSHVPNSLQLRHQVLEDADVVCCTLSSSGSPPLLETVLNGGAVNNVSSGVIGPTTDVAGRRDGISAAPFCFDVVIIDEAAQAVEPSALIPLKYNPKVLIMVGDACQLRATVLSKEAVKFNFGRSLFERFQMVGYQSQMLLTQYRMHPDIARFPSIKFYGGKLANDVRMVPSKKSKGSRWKRFHDDRSRRLGPIVFHNIAHGKEKISGCSYSNIVEAEYIFGLYDDLRVRYPSTCTGGIGIIAAYKAQTTLLKEIFRRRYGYSPEESSKYGGAGCDVEICTVDGFQGREKDIIIFSCVRSSDFNDEDGSNIGFMNDSQRLNVALTRAKYSLWIVGDMDNMASSGKDEHSIWRDLIRHCRSRGFVYTTK